MRNRPLWMARAVMLAFGACVWLLGPGAGGLRADTSVQCSADTVTVTGDFGKVRFRVEIADDDAERSQGLMFVREMARDRGMLFLWDQPGRRTFWMRNTYIPLDMLFIGPDGVIRHLHHRAQPLSDDTIDGGTGVSAVLEINGGLSRRYGIREGDQVWHPAFAADGVPICG